MLQEQLLAAFGDQELLLRETSPFAFQYGLPRSNGMERKTLRSTLEACACRGRTITFATCAWTPISI